MTNRTLTLVAAAAAFVAPLAAAADTTPADGIVRVAYSDAAPAKLTCAPLYLCDLALQPGEIVANVAIGDSVRWILSPVTGGTAGSAPHILIKPTDADLATNMIVTTNKRTYYIDLRSTKTPEGALRTGFTYAAEPPPAPPVVATPAPVATATPEPTRPLDFAYAVGGDRRLKPTRVYNDGKHVYVELDPHVQQTPALLAVGPDGDQLVNYRVVDGHIYVIDGTPDKLALVIGSGKHQQRATITHQ